MRAIHISQCLVIPAAVSLAFGLLGACQTSTPLKRVTDLPPGVAGIWQSNGYGYILDASGEYPALFHHTPEFCIEDKDTAAMLSHYLTPENLRYDANGEAFYFSAALEDYAIEMRSITARPATCGLEISDDPLTVFDSFASYMETHYAFFDLYGVNWAESTRAARAAITPRTTDAQLYSILKSLLRPLKDGHIELSADVGGKAVSYEPGQGTVGDALERMAARDGTALQTMNNKMMEAYWFNDVKRDILNGKGIMAANKRIQYGMTGGDIGYIAIATEGGYAGKGLGHEAADLDALRRVLDDAVAMFNGKSARAVIIDLSVNLGGYDFAAIEIAGRFATQRSLAYTKFAVDSRGQEPFPIYLNPHQGARYIGPVALVTSNVTVSAGEMMTMALRTQPNVVHIGEATRGALSDVLSKRLPNGWSLDLSNEVYHDHTGAFWEGRGIPPHIPLQIFDAENPFEGHVGAITNISAGLQTGQIHPASRP